MDVFEFVLVFGGCDRLVVVELERAVGGKEELFGLVVLFFGRDGLKVEGESGGVSGGGD